ncbi:hypothetical protein HW561_13925 [Rhodobacteraceae bacterium B1Z28]|uniref:Uncharacterized protein n=1 Tax=Ruegeria haliotis TaxID=2747601 RepID=A0ABX2PRV3_9RHOB|nr:hypothetical protein [Ruegeria haliotis]NVO56888.1 hypothetical protein [Ruegeria haliotis]
MSLKFNNSEDLRAAVAAETKEGLHRLVASLRDSDLDVKPDVSAEAEHTHG